MIVLIDYFDMAEDKENKEEQNRIEETTQGTGEKSIGLARILMQ